MKIVPLDKSYNYKEIQLDGFDAVSMSVYQLFQTPVGSLPKLPNEGFDLDDLRGLSMGSAQYDKLTEELKQKIETLIGSPSTCEIKRTGEVIDITITYFQDGEIKVIPIRQSEQGARAELLFDNIMLK